MISVPQAIESIIRQRPLLLEGLAEGIINLSSLARTIQPEVERVLQKEIKTGALIMALKRFEPKVKEHLSRKINNVICDIDDITVRSNLMSFTYQNSTTLVEAQARFIKEIAQIKSIFYTISQGVFETTIILSESFQSSFELIFRDEKLINHTAGLSSITLRLPKVNKEIPGLYHYIFSRIIWEGINVYEVISTTHEFSIIVKNDKVEQAFSVLRNLTS
jgi:hypothetical protein